MLRRFSCRLFGDQRGAQIVELAILLPILLLLVFGIVDFGRGFFSWVIVTNGAREGARAAAVGKDFPTVVTKVTNAVSGLYVTSVESGSCASTSNGVLCVTEPTTGTYPGDPVSIQVQYNFKFIILPDIMAWTGSPGMPAGVFPLTAQSTMRLE